MKYKTFGNAQNKTVMLLHGNLMCWRQFEETIPYLAENYHVVAVSFDGFDNTGKTTYPGAKKEALKFMPQKQYKMVVDYKKPDFKFPGYLLK